MDLAGDLPRIYANYQFVEVFLELITNAVKAMETSAEKRLEISSRRATGGWVEVMVRDTGFGIPLVDKDKVFDLFYTRSAGHQDFGLWFVKTFVLGIGGIIDCESNDAGTTFVVKLPAPL